MPPLQLVEGRKRGGHVVSVGLPVDELVADAVDFGITDKDPSADPHIADVTAVVPSFEGAVCDAEFVGCLFLGEQLRTHSQEARIVDD